MFVTTHHDKYGCWAVRLESWAPAYYSVSTCVKMLHTWSSRGWGAAPFKPVSPATVRANGLPPYGGMLLRRRGAFVPLVEYSMLRPPLRMSADELQLVALDMGLPRPPEEFDAAVAHICQFVFADRSEEERNCIIANASKAPDSAYARLCSLVDPITEMVLDDLSDADDAFPEFTDVVKKRRRKRLLKPRPQKTNKKL